VLCASILRSPNSVKRYKLKYSDAAEVGVVVSIDKPGDPDSGSHQATGWEWLILAAGLVGIIGVVATTDW
jgi:hypothetical protein